MKASEILKAGLERLGPNGEHWAGGGQKNNDIYCECMTTVLNNVGEDELEALDVFKRIFSTDRLAPIWAWNDNPKRKFPEVKAKFLEAIALAENQEAANA